MSLTFQQVVDQSVREIRNELLVELDDIARRELGGPVIGPWPDHSFTGLASIMGDR